MNQMQDNEITIFDFFETVLNAKVTLISFIITTVLIGAAYGYLKEPEYESKLTYQVDSLPPFYDSHDNEIPMKDFKKLFYTQRLFDDWKKNNKDSLLLYRDFNQSQTIEGIMISKHEDKRMAIMETDDQLGAYILIRTDKLRLLNDFYNYADYINNVLTSEYILRAKEEIVIIDKRFDDFTATTDIITSKLLAIDRYIMEAEGGANVLILSRPEYPFQVWPRILVIYALSFVLGLLLGITYIFFSDANRLRKEQLSKSIE
tara:strand:- start:51 stop:830 length:780 start_codon:yes stop_codon:yes gene_type:complete